MPRSIKPCAFCTLPATTVDHVPPKSMFDPRPSNMITVPCCEDCRVALGGSDELFRNFVALLPEAKSSVGRIREKAVRGLNRHEARRALEELNENIEFREWLVETDEGVTKQMLPDFQFDQQRLNFVLNRTAYGIYFDRHNERLVFNETRSCWALLRPELDNASFPFVYATIYAAKEHGTFGEVGTDQFEYYYLTSSLPNSIVWVFRIFGNALVFGLIGEKEHIPLKSETKK